MESARPLREVLGDLTGAGGDLAGDPERMLREAGHGDLPDGLVAEAVVSYADTAAIEVAEHLAPFVTAHGPFADPAAPPDPGQAWELLATAPEPGWDEPALVEESTAMLAPEWGAEPTPDAGNPPELDFGAGDRSGDAAPGGAEPVPAEPGAPAPADAESYLDPSFPVLSPADPYWPGLDSVAEPDEPAGGDEVDAG